MRAPLLGDLIGHSIGRFLLTRAALVTFNDPTLAFPRKVLDVCEFQIYNHAGFMRSYISTLRHFPLTSLHKEYAKVGALTNLPVNVLWVGCSCPYFLQSIESFLKTPSACSIIGEQ